MSIFAAMNRQRLSILLMTVTIAVIVLFQAFWLHKNYLEEQRLFTLHSSILFRETIFKIQASKLHLDTNINIRIADKSGITSMTNVLQEEIRDTSLPHMRHKSSIVVSLNRNRFDSADTTEAAAFAAPCHAGAPHQHSARGCNDSCLE